MKNKSTSNSTNSKPVTLFDNHQQDEELKCYCEIPVSSDNEELF